MLAEAGAYFLHPTVDLYQPACRLPYIEQYELIPLLYYFVGPPYCIGDTLPY